MNSSLRRRLLILILISVFFLSFSAKNLAVLTRLIEFDSIAFPPCQGRDRFVVSFTYRILTPIVDGHRYGGHKLVHIGVHGLIPGL